MNLLGDVVHKDDRGSLPQVELLFDFDFDKRVLQACHELASTLGSRAETSVFIS